MGMSPEEFVKTIQSKNIQGPGLSQIIRIALADLLGDISAAASLAYMGAAENGDIRGFATRADELFGSSAPMVFTHIVRMAEKNGKTE